MTTTETRQLVLSSMSECITNAVMRGDTRAARVGAEVLAEYRDSDLTAAESIAAATASVEYQRGNLEVVAA